MIFIEKSFKVGETPEKIVYIGYTPSWNKREKLKKEFTPAIHLWGSWPGGSYRVEKSLREYLKGKGLRPLEERYDGWFYEDMSILDPILAHGSVASIMTEVPLLGPEPQSRVDKVLTAVGHVILAGQEEIPEYEWIEDFKVMKIMTEEEAIEYMTGEFCSTTAETIMERAREIKTVLKQHREEVEGFLEGLASKYGYRERMEYVQDYEFSDYSALFSVCRNLTDMT